jgi:small-conductance mechanosensitive channel
MSDRIANNSLSLMRFWIAIWLALATIALHAEPVQSSSEAVPLLIGQRTIHTFRAPLGMFTAKERADGARRRIEAGFEQVGEGWTSRKTTDQGIQIELDGKPMFFVLPGDARELAGETAEDLANQAVRTLQIAWREQRERRDPRASLDALLKVGLATVLLVLLLTVTVKLSNRLRLVTFDRLSTWVTRPTTSHFSLPIVRTMPSLVQRLLLLMTWLLSMFLIFVYSTYSMGQFVVTRPASESLSNAVMSLGSDALLAIASSLPGNFIAVGIFLFAWVITRISQEYFSHVESKSSDGNWLNTHTAPATRRIVNASLWLFAIAMAYPYLPGSHTEAFKGLSVMVGLMVSIGASGIVGQIASGLILVYTYALKRGEYVRINDCEGTVTELSLFVTRLRTGMGEEIAIPNALVLGNVTRNFSRIRNSAGRSGYVLDTTVTIGYDTAWRQVHSMLIEAAEATPEILDDPAPYVVQTALSDFYVAYKLVVNVGTDVPSARAKVASDLHAAIQDAFNHHGVQIMSPHYFSDPSSPKLVAKENWHTKPEPSKK